MQHTPLHIKFTSSKQISCQSCANKITREREPRGAFLFTSFSTTLAEVHKWVFTKILSRNMLHSFPNLPDSLT